MDFGKVLKLRRISKKMTQSEVSNGICSVTHLSKIENGTKEANIETIILLMDKLGINYTELIHHHSKLDDELRFLEQSLYYYHLNDCQIRIDSIHTYYISQELEVPIDYYIYSMYYCVLNQQLQEAEELQSIIKKVKNLGREQLELFTFVSHLLDLRQGHIQRGIDGLLKNTEDYYLRKGDVYYALSEGYALLGNHTLSLLYSHKALNHYLSDHNVIKVSLAYLRSAVSLTEQMAFSEAEQYFNKLFLNLQQIKEHGLSERVKMNYARLLHLQCRHQEALELLQGCLATLNSASPTYYSTLLFIRAGLCDIHIATRHPDSLMLIEDMIELAIKHDHKDYYYTYTIQKMLHARQEEQLAHFIIHSAIPYYEASSHQNQLLQCYKQLLASCSHLLTTEQISTYVHKLWN